MIDILLCGVFCFLLAIIPYLDDIKKIIHRYNIQQHRKRIRKVGRRGLTPTEYNFCIKYKIIR